MLVVTDDLVLFKEVNEVAVDDMFQKFTGDGGEGDRSVVGCLAFVTLLVDGCDVGCAPIIRYLSLV